ncbi:MAG TPA: CusA/CzcA family heavy metal efflux RND transporter [Candidatus Omnitrophota bacterium]|nr:CusA/CzcA family heavy metal efflux RND transporter [Candidatus Omnitrophota bacterium]
MIKKLIEFSSRYRFLVLLLVAAAVALSIHSMRRIPLDAIPDLSDTQVIVYSRWDRSPDIIEDQVTYPIVTALVGAPKVRDVRAVTDFGFSYVYVIFEDGTDVYWARSRVLEYLSKIQPRLPKGVQTELGPDATGVGWVYQYALVDRTGKHGLEELRSFQDWTLRYAIQSVPGVAEVASIGGFQKQYQIQVDPNKLLGYGISISQVVDAVRKGNNETGGRLVEFSGAEYMVRSRGYARSVTDLENIVLRASEKGVPVLVKDVAHVTIGPELRRGLADLDGEGDAVGGIVVMRYHENALNVIERVKERLEALKPSLPEGMELVTVYDRSELINRSIDTLKHQLTEEIVIVSLVILLFLWHIPSAIVPILTIPIAVLLAFIPLYHMGITSNIMSLAGIAISIGVLVDGAIVEVENAYKKLERWHAGGRIGDFHVVRLEALKEVGPTVFFSLLVIAAAFIPIFTLVDQEGRLFKPLAFSKNFTMAIAAILAVTLDPALRMSFTRMDPFTFRPKFLAKIATSVLVGRYHPEEKHPVSRVLFKFYEPAARWVLRRPKTTIASAALLFLLTIPVYFQLGSEFMPPLNEGTVLYMPTTLPGISVTEAQRLMQLQDKILKSFPEVERVFGKAGRAETATDPAPLSMMETTIVLKPEREWRKRPRWYSDLPEFFQAIFRRFQSDRISYEDLVTEMDERLKIPGVTNAWTMPIKNRIDMLSTGIRTPIGIKIYGNDLRSIEKTGLAIENVVRGVRGARSVFAERVTGGYFLDFQLKRESLARYGISVDEANEVVMTAIGGETVTTTVEGRERYSVQVRYAREFRDDLSSLGRTLVPTSSGAQIPISQIADLVITQGPSMIRDENGKLSGYVYVDIVDRDLGGFVRDAKKAVESGVSVPEGTYLVWSGQYENMLRVRDRLFMVVPLTIFLIVLLLYLNTRSWVKTAIVLLAVPFSLIGAVWFLYLLGYNISIATWVGMIALMGLDAETGVFMLLYLDLAYDEARQKGELRNEKELDEAIIHGAVKRIRPKMMTVAAAMIGLLPILWSMGTGADLMKRIAAPMFGGLLTSFILELLVYPPVYKMWKWRTEVRKSLEKTPS